MLDQLQGQILDLIQNKNVKYAGENLVYIIGPLSALIASRFGRKAWFRYEFYLTIALSIVLYLRPQYLLSVTLNSPLKPTHVYLCSFLGCYLIFSSLFSIFLGDSQDEAVFYGHLWSRIISSSLIVVSTIFAYYEGYHWNFRLLCLVTGFAITGLFINLIFLRQSKKPKGLNPFQDPVNNITKIDAFLLLIWGVIVFGYPDKTMFGFKEINEGHRLIYRICGAIILSLSYQSFCVSEFIYLRDKKKFMLTRLYGSLIELVTILVGFYCFKVLSLEICQISLLVNTAYNIFLFYGYYITPQDVQEIQHSKSN